MGVRRAMAIAAGVTVASFGIPLATAAAAYAAPPPIYGVITGLHTFTLEAGTPVLGELLHPVAPGYNADVPVVGISTVAGVTTVTTGYTYLPLNRSGETTEFTVVSLTTPPPPIPPGPPTPPGPPWSPWLV